MIAARGLRGEANRARLRERMAAAFDNSFETLRPARCVLLAIIAKA